MVIGDIGTGRNQRRWKVARKSFFAQLGTEIIVLCLGSVEFLK